MPKTVEQIRAEYEGAAGRAFFAEGRFAVVNCTFSPVPDTWPDDAQLPVAFAPPITPKNSATISAP